MITDALQSEKRKKQIEDLATRAHVKNPMWGFVWYIIGLPVILGVSTFITWGDIGFRFQALPMVLLVCALYTAVWVNRYQSSLHRSYRAIGLSVFYTTVGYLVIFSVLGLLRFYYSRSFLFSSYGMMVLWISFGMVFFRRRHEDYVIIRGGMADQLMKYSKIGWKFVRNFNFKKKITNFDGIVVDLHAHDDEKMIKTLADSSLQGIPVLHAASVLERYSGRANLDYLAHEGLYNLRENRTHAVVKRIWEVGLILPFTPLIIPILAITALAIKLDSSGPLLFTQERVGKNGKLFKLYKFRSMYTDAEENGSQFADKQDDRVTRVGRFIRKYRIDELPQFWNVLKGDMSLVGPRPEQKEFVEFFKDEIPFYSYRHQVRPGITGWAQVNDGYAAGLAATERKLEYDLYYVKNLSLSLDLLIVYATVKTILTGFGSR